MAFASYVFDGIDDVIQHVWSSTGTDAERRTLTISTWVKLNLGAGEEHIIQAINASKTEYTSFAIFSLGVDMFEADEVFAFWEDPPNNNVWTHYVIAIDTTQANQFNRYRVYKNGVLLPVAGGVAHVQNELTQFFNSGSQIVIGALAHLSNFYAGRFAFFDVVSGQSLGPESFAFDDNGTWTRKTYEGSYGNFGFSLDGSQGFNDVSGNGFHFTNVGGVQLDFDDLPPHVAAEEGFSGIYLGETQINTIKLGSTDIKAVYLGSTKIFEKA